MANTFRSDIVAGAGTMMNAFITANPSLLRRHFRMKPPTPITDTPFSYIDGRPEVISYDASIRTRRMSLAIVVLDRWTESGEVMDRMDDLTDSLIAHFSSYYHIVAGSWWSDITVTDEDQEGFVGSRFVFDIRFADGSQ